MSWLLADMKKKMNDARSTIEQSFKQAAEQGTEIEKEAEIEEKKIVEDVKEEEGAKEEATATENAKKQMAALFGGLKVGSGVASTKLFEYANNASKKLGEVKNAVIENTMLGELNKSQDEFEKQLEVEREKLKHIDLPWQGLPDEQSAKKQMLSLSTDTRNFLRDSPANSEYSYDEQQAMATMLLKEDPNLANVRFQLVPKQVKENKFWQNYFYRIGLIRQSMAANTTTTAPSVVEQEVVEEKKETASVSEAAPVKVEEKEEEELKLCDTQSESEEEEGKEATTEQPDAGEQTLTSVDEEWEREILADLNDYDDVVGKTGKDEEAWEAEIQEMLNSE